MKASPDGARRSIAESAWLSLSLKDSFFRFIARLASLYLPKNPGSIKYQLTNPASSPMTNTIRAVIFSLVVVGLPAREGDIRRKIPPMVTTGPKVASFME